ncbi:MAG: HupE/UreJ family protein [Hyphomicrobiales bacterium]
MKNKQKQTTRATSSVFPGSDQSQLSYMFLIALAFFICFSVPGRSHEIQPAIADLLFSEDGSSYELDIALNIEAVLAGIGTEHDDTDSSPQAEEYNALRALPADELKERVLASQNEFLGKISLQADSAPLKTTLAEIAIPDMPDLAVARPSRLKLSGAVPAGAETVVFSWASDFGAIVLRGPLTENGEGYSGYLQDGARSDPISIKGPTEQSVWQVIADYIVIGFEHIIPKGLDHILFVVGLFLLSTKLAPLLWQVTSFTLAHTITLALGMLGLVNVPGYIVEPLIAASIVYICVENLFMDSLSRWRPFVIFGFGLLHGLGFASVLTEIGLSQSHFVTGLIAFNVGVELGQLSVILLCFLAVGFWFRSKTWYRPAVIVPGSLVIAAVGTYWFLERTVLA